MASLGIAQEWTAEEPVGGPPTAGFTAPIAEATSGAVADAVRLADTWLDGA